MKNFFDELDDFQEIGGKIEYPEYVEGRIY